MTATEGAPATAPERGSWRVDGPQPLGSFVPAGVDDQLVQVCVQLAAELWVTRRRLAAVEAQLFQAGLIVSPDTVPPADQPEDHAERDEFVSRVFGGFLT